MSPEAISAYEVEMLARKMAASYAGREAFFRDLYKLDPKKAKKRATASPKKAQHIIDNKPSSEIDWYDLNTVYRQGPEGSYTQVWNQIKQDALDTLKGGGFVSAAVSEQSPWRKATCLAARDQFSEEWQPRGGIEQTLIDMLAQTFVKWQMWIEMEVKWGALKDEYEWNDGREEPHSGPQMRYAESAKYAAQMADRSHRQFMRTLRSMRDLRRYNVNVTVTGAANVNVGPQQINVNTDDGKDTQSSLKKSS